MKKTILTAFVVTASFLAVSAAPHVDCKETKLPDGRTKYERNVYFNKGKLIMLQCTKDGKNAVKNKWGEYFFGLEFGRMNRTNGGWSIWDFLSCYEYNKGVNNLLARFMPENVSLNNVNGVVVVDLAYPSMDGGKLRLRMMQFPSHPDWIFVRLTSENFQLWRLDFSAYPGNSNVPKDRERHLATGKEDYTLNTTAVKTAPQTPYIAMYNKFVQDNTGCLLIYEPEKFTELAVNKTTGGILNRLMVKKGVKEFYFAVGQFTDKPADDTVKRFLTEDGDGIREFMKTINWNPALPEDQFAKSLEEAKKLGVAADKLETLRSAHDKAVKAKDAAGAAKVVSELEALKKSASSQGLDAFR